MTTTNKNVRNNIEDFLERYCEFMQSPEPQQEQFTTDVFNLVMHDTDDSCVTVLPARCGIGKSKTIQSLISYCTQDELHNSRKDKSIGLVIITDSLDRLKEYKADANNIDSDLKGNFLYEGHKKYCGYISSESDKPLARQIGEAKNKPIVLLSTQRYFSMPENLREQLFEFTINKQKLKRNIVIFDEKPYFFKTKKLNSENIGKCASAIQEGIPSNETKKEWILSEFWKFREKIETLLKDKEKIKENTDIFYFKDSNTENLTTNDDLFFETIEKHKQTIQKVYIDALTDLYDFKQLIVDGAFFITKKKQSYQDYQTYFILLKINQNLFYLNQEKAKNFVFDATADIDPDYKVDYIEMLDFTHYNVPLDNLTILQADVNTSKTKLANNDKTIKALNKIIKDEAKNTIGNAILVTYKNIESKFKNQNLKTEHFGNTKGTNDFNKLPKMLHIGLNRFSDFSYFIKYIQRHKDVLDKLKQLNEDDSRKYIKSIMKMSGGIFVKPEMNEIMFNSILSDFEQTVFRTAIRNYNNKKPVTICTYWSDNTYSQLNKMIRERYERYGVKFKSVGVPDEIQKLNVLTRKPNKNKKSTNAQKILQWLDNQPKGREFKVSELLQETNLTDNQLQKTKAKNKTIENKLDKYRTDKKGYYKIK